MRYQNATIIPGGQIKQLIKAIPYKFSTVNIFDYDKNKFFSISLLLKCIIANTHENQDWVI